MESAFGLTPGELDALRDGQSTFPMGLDPQFSPPLLHPRNAPPMDDRSPPCPLTMASNEVPHRLALEDHGLGTAPNH